MERYIYDEGSIRRTYSQQEAFVWFKNIQACAAGGTHDILPDPSNSPCTRTTTRRLPQTGSWCPEPSSSSLPRGTWIFWRGHAGHEGLEEVVRILMLDVWNDLANEDWAPAEQLQDFGQTNPKTSSMIYHLKSSRMLAYTITSFSFVYSSLRYTLLLWFYNCCR